jgi:hypothetical protein
LVSQEGILILIIQVLLEASVVVEAPHRELVLVVVMLAMVVEMVEMVIIRLIVAHGMVVVVQVDILVMGGMVVLLHHLQQQGLVVLVVAEIISKVEVLESMVKELMVLLAMFQLM